jgi:Coenzyme PQQ synthesis protein D (PqqD)
MKKIAHEHLPLKRTERLIVDELQDEVLVYDLDRHQAHCLNSTAALVWKHCDGQTNPPDIARRLEDKLRVPCKEDHVWLALRQLEETHLLEQPIALPPQLAGMSRRQMVRTLGVAAAVAVPLVTSIVAPPPAQAASCIPTGQPCSLSAVCCSTQSNCVPPGTCP